MKRDRELEIIDRDAIIANYTDIILSEIFPCLMAQTIFKTDKVQVELFEGFGSKDAAEKLYNHLEDFIEKYDFSSNDFNTFMAVFPNEGNLSESDFEALLWQQLQQVHNIDEHPWDNAVSKEPNNEKFSFSIAGKAFYIVGMHPNSSRLARQVPYPTMVFNLHWQFEKLREMGTYQMIKKKIRKRDKQLQGTNNPMLEDFGTKSEARQYSGKAVSNEWKCPFHHK